jgi:ABC-type sulfate transport system permease component
VTITGAWALRALTLALIIALAVAWAVKPQNVHVDRVITRTVTVPAQPRFHTGENVWVDYNDDGSSLVRGTILGYQVKDGGVVYGVNMDAYAWPQDFDADDLVKVG